MHTSGEIRMAQQIVISADFSDPLGPVLSGPSEASLVTTKLRVADVAGCPLIAVKRLGGEFRRALVLDHHFDEKAGWATRRRNFRKCPAPDASVG
jgi:hypothetical protein